MKKARLRINLGSVMLGLLVVVTVALSAAALSPRPVPVASSAVPAVPTTSTPRPTTANRTPSVVSRTPSPAATSSTPAHPSPSASTTPSGTSSPLTVLILGDGVSSGAAADTWVGIAEKQLGWTNVVNLSSPGRGYVKRPLTCDTTPCANFEGSIPAVVEAHPDLVITFGGTADGDYDLSPAATRYYADLHQALPNAQLVAVSPVTTLAPVPYYFTMHDQTISAAVEKVGGTFIDVGQPGSGDGPSLSGSAQSAIAARIAAALS